MPDGFDPRSRPWYKDALNSNGASLTEPYIDAVTGQMIISIGTAVKKAGQTLGVIGADLTLQTITDSINHACAGTARWVCRRHYRDRAA